MSALREVFAYLGFEFDKAKLQDADRSVEGLIEKVQGLAAAFAGGAILSGLNSISEQLDVFDDISARTGVAASDLQALGLAFETTGSSTEEMNGALLRLQSALGGLSDGGKEQTEVFKKLGVDIKDAAGKAPTLATALPQIFENFNSIGSEAEKARIATQLFGRTGVKLIPVLEQGAAGFQSMRDQLAELGGGATREATEAAGRYRDSLARLHYSFFSLKGLIASAVFPRLEALVNSSAKAVGRFSAWAKETTAVDTAAVGLASTLALKLGSALAPYLKAGLKFTAIFLAIDDVIGFLQGKDSVIGRLLDKAFGDGAATAVRTWVNDAIYEFGRFIKSGEDALKVWESRSASTWDKTVAAFAVSLRDMVRGFPAFRAEVDETFAGIAVSVNESILSMTNAWNDFVDSLHLPDFLKIDTAPREQQLADQQNRRQSARERSDAAFLDGANDPSTVGRVRLAVQPGESPRFEQGPLSSPDAVLAAAHGRPEVAIQSGPVRPDLPPSFNMVQNNRIEVTVPAGTPAAQAREIARTAAEGVRDANRSAKQALTQRGAK